MTERFETLIVRVTVFFLAALVFSQILLCNPSACRLLNQLERLEGQIIAPEKEGNENKQ